MYIDIFANKIIQLIDKFKVDLSNKVVLTEAATGNFVVTPLIAAAAGAKVYAYTKNSKYGSVETVRSETKLLANKLGIDDKIDIITDLNDVPFHEVDVLTNTGFLRPINKAIINKLSSQCVIPLMWEPWEFRAEDLDLDACVKKGIKVYGTNEGDSRVRTMDYLGYTVLKLLLENCVTPPFSKLLILGCEKFCNPVNKILKINKYDVVIVSNYEQPTLLVDQYDVIVLLEHQNDVLLLGDNGFIDTQSLSKKSMVLHICGNVSINKMIKFRMIPQKPAKFGYMSFTADYVDERAVIALHSAGLKVAEGMLRANEKKLEGSEYKDFMEKHFPALAFNDSTYY